MVCDGVGLGAGGFGEGFTVGLLDVGLGLGWDGAGAELDFGEALARGDFLATWLDEADGEGLDAAGEVAPPGLPDAEGVVEAAVAGVAA